VIKIKPRWEYVDPPLFTSGSPRNNKPHEFDTAAEAKAAMDEFLDRWNNREHYAPASIAQQDGAWIAFVRGIYTSSTLPIVRAGRYII